MRNFRELDVWKSSVLFVKKIYELTDTFPNIERYNLISQISRCAVSIPSNIAEGCSRNSQKDFSRFLQISLGSSFELETQIEIAKELNFISVEQYVAIISELNTNSKKNTIFEKIC